MHVTIHPSQYPERVRADLIESLRRREVKHKFHYESRKQAQRWLAVHEAHSPARTDADCQRVYEEAFSHVAKELEHSTAHVIGLGCGGGQKDAALLQKLKVARAQSLPGRAAAPPGAESIYTAVDVSLPLVITARERAREWAQSTRGLVCDLEAAGDIADHLGRAAAEPDRKVTGAESHTRRLFTFFGMMPNSEPEVIVPRLAALRDKQDQLLVSANLAPGSDYRDGVQRVRPQYDNPQTAEWLMTFLTDLGVEQNDGEIRFGIEECATGLLRIRADFGFARARTFRVENEEFKFGRGDSIRLFFSYRHTPGRLSAILNDAGLQIARQWISASGEEGVFLIS